MLSLCVGPTQPAGLIKSGRPRGFGRDGLMPTSFCMFASCTRSHASYASTAIAFSVPIATTHRSTIASTMSSPAVMTSSSVRVEPDGPAPCRTARALLASSSYSCKNLMRNSTNLRSFSALRLSTASCTPNFSCISWLSATQSPLKSRLNSKSPSL